MNVLASQENHENPKEVPYRLVFSQMPRSQIIPGAEKHIVMEEEIQEITHFSSYKVATSAGLIKSAFSSGDLTPFSGNVEVNKDKLVSVKQGALEINSANKFTVNRCKCKGKCNNGQCSCIRSGIQCSNLLSSWENLSF